MRSTHMAGHDATFVRSESKLSTKRTGTVTNTVVGAVVFVFAVSPAAGQIERFNPPQQYYLALGDSIAYGFQRPKFDGGLPALAFNTGYVDVFAAYLQKIRPSLTVVNYGCPGETTRSFATSQCGWPAVGELHNTYVGTQLDAALAFLRSHPGQVSPITLTLWGNDVREFVLDCQGELLCLQRGVSRFIAEFRGRLGAILSELRAAAPSAEIII